MKDTTRKRVTGRLKSLAERAWFAYLSIALLQIKVMLGIWEYRDLAPGDTSYYYVNVFKWLDEGTCSMVLAPVYTLFLAILHSMIGDPFWVLIVAQIAIATSASLLTLALMRRLLPKHVALIIAVWWAILAINFDTIYNVHLFATLFPLVIFIIAAYADNIYGRGMVLAGLFLTAVLIRLEYSALFVLWLLILAGYEYFICRNNICPYPIRKYLIAYGLPILVASLVIGIFFSRSSYTIDETVQHIVDKQTLNVGQIYAFNRVQQGDSWQGDYWTEFQSLLERDFGQSSLTFSQAFLLNPRAMLEHLWWNIKLVPSGMQLALFDYYHGGPNPDYLPAKKSSLVWIPFLAVMSLCVIAVVICFIKPYVTKRPFVRNIFAWLLMLSAAFFGLGIMITQHPRPSYVYPFTTFFMALTGLGLHRFLEYTRMSEVVKFSIPIVGISLILFLPAHYGADYENHYGYKGQPLREAYERFAPHINRVGFKSSDVFVTPEADHEVLCNYLGISCRLVEMESGQTIEKMSELISASMGGEQVENVYILYFEDMIWTFTSPSYRKDDYPMGYVALNCFSRINEVMTCSDGTIDLNRGVMNNGSIKIPLSAALFVNDGYVVERKDFAAENGYYLQVLMRQNKVASILVADGTVFRSNFNQQYLLGNFDRRTFSETYNASPLVRILKIK